MTDIDTPFNAIELRVLGSLMEKELATPEYYPLSLNALTNACNQKSNRAPVMALDESAIAEALQSLKEKQIVCQSDAGRVARYWHNFTGQHNLIRREAALLCLLLLRGHQTAGELRGRTERLCTFDRLEEVIQSLDSLAELGLVCKLPRQPGQKEQRYGHRLGGDGEAQDLPQGSRQQDTAAAETGRDRLTELENTVAALKQQLELLAAEFLAFKNGRQP